MKKGVIIKGEDGTQILLQRTADRKAIHLSLVDLAKGRVASVALGETAWRELTDGTRGMEELMIEEQITLFTPSDPPPPPPRRARKGKTTDAGADDSGSGAGGDGNSAAGAGSSVEGDPRGGRADAVADPGDAGRDDARVADTPGETTQAVPLPSVLSDDEAERQAAPDGYMLGAKRSPDGFLIAQMTPDDAPCGVCQKRIIAGRYIVVRPDGEVRHSTCHLTASAEAPDEGTRANA